MDTNLQHTVGYEQDFSAWAFEQARFMRERRWDLLDIENIAEELATLGRSERRELENRLGQLTGHLLKWMYQPEKQSNSWLSSIREQRRRIARLLKENPSLQSGLEGAIATGYEDGRDLAVQDTNLPYETFPEICPYSWEELMHDGSLREPLGTNLTTVAEAEMMNFEPNS